MQRDKGMKVLIKEDKRIRASRPVQSKSPHLILIYLSLYPIMTLLINFAVTLYLYHPLLRGIEKQKL